MAEPGPIPPPHLLHIFATFVAAGPQIRVARLINHFGAAYRHTIVAMDGRKDAGELLGGIVPVRFVDPPATRNILLRPLRMRRLIRYIGPDLLLTYNWGSFDAVFAAATLRGLHHVHHEDGFNLDEARGQKRRRVLLRRLALRRARQVVVCSQRLLTIARQSWHVQEECLRLIENGIESTHFEPGSGVELRRRLGIPEHDLVVGAVGHLRPVKNFQRLLEACAMVHSRCCPGRGVHLLLVGDGPERAALEELSGLQRPPGGRVLMVGRQTDLTGYYRAMDLFALTSDSEQHPVALLEAMSCGLAAVATDVGDVRNVLPAQEQRFIVSLTAPAIARKLAAGMEELLGNEVLRKDIGRQNRRQVMERYGAKDMFAAYRTLYEEALPMTRRTTSR